MKFNSQICASRSQSERLLALGLKKETADCVVSSIGSKDRLIHTEEPIYVTESLNNKKIPNYLAWSLHRLLCLLPDKTPYSDGYLTVEIINENVYIVLVIENVEQRVLKYTKGDLYDNLISCINFFVKESLLNKDYLEE